MKRSFVSCLIALLLILLTISPVNGIAYAMEIDSAINSTDVRADKTDISSNMPVMQDQILDEAVPHKSTNEDSTQQLDMSEAEGEGDSTEETMNAVSEGSVDEAPKNGNVLEEITKEVTEDEKVSEEITEQASEINIMSVPTFTKDTKYFQVTQSNVTVYDNSTGKLVPVGSLAKGAIYPLNKIFGDWIEIQFSDKKGYIWKPATIPSEESPKKKGSTQLLQEKYITTIQNLPVYDNSTGQLIQIGNITEGIKYKVIREYGDWMEILFSGRIAYIYKTGYKLAFDSTSPAFTKDTKYFQVTESNVTVYDNSTGKLVPVGSLAKGAIYPLNQISGDWIEIQFSDKKGYIWKPATIPSEESPKKKGSTQLLQEKYITTIENLPVYDNSTGQLIQIGNITEGIKYKVIGEYGDWMEILFSGRIAYVYKTGYSLPFDSNSQYFMALQNNITIYDNSTGSLVPVGKLTQDQVYPIGQLYGDWIEIQFGNKKGYVWKDATSPTSTIPKKIGNASLNKNIYFEAIQNLSVYANSTGKLIQIGDLNKGIQYPVIQQYGDRMEILFAGRVGYVDKTDIELIFSDHIKYFEASQNNVQIVENVNGKLIKVGKLVEGEIYERDSDYGDWHKIRFGDRTGFVWKDATKAVLSPTYINSTKSTGSNMLKLTMNATVYDNTSGSLVPFATVEKDAVISYISKLGDWYKVSLLGREGYIYADAAVVIAKDIVNPNQTYTYSQMEKDIQELLNVYPSLIQKEVIGTSVDGRNLYAIKLGKGNTEIFFNGAHHAREHITTNLLMEMVDTYSQSYVKNTKIDGYNTRNILDKTSIWFVPMVNPDGVSLVQLGHKSAKEPSYVLKLNNYSTNFGAWKANIRGVDLNRQYPVDWNNIKDNTGKPGPKNYKGPNPLSEPESKALYDFTLAHDFKTAVAYHSAGEILYWNYHQNSARYNRDLAIAQSINGKTGYSLVFPGPNPSGGGYTDWFIQNQLKPGFTPEVSPPLYESQVPISYFPRIWSQNYSVGLLLADEAYKNRNNR